MDEEYGLGEKAKRAESYHEVVMLAHASIENNAKSKKDSAIDVEKHEGDLHGLVCLGVSHTVVLQDTSNVHERVRALSNKHSHHDIICRHVIRKRQ